MKQKAKDTLVWTWMIDGSKGPELCWFVSRTKKRLVEGGKPSPEAKAVRIRMTQDLGLKNR